MTPHDRALLRDAVARRRMELAEHDRRSAREDAGRAALAALHEAERRAKERRTRGPSAIRSKPPVTVAAPVSMKPLDNDLCSTLMDALTARVAAAMPPVEYVADGFDLAEHMRGIVDVVRRARGAEAAA